MIIRKKYINHLVTMPPSKIVEEANNLGIGTTFSNNHKIYLGIDNGVSGAITIISSNGDIMLHEKTPIKKCLNYTKKKAFMNRVDFKELSIPYQFIDSKEWQKELLPSGLVKDELKTGALSVAKRLYPKQTIHNADSILIALYCFRKSTGRNLKPVKSK